MKKAIWVLAASLRVLVLATGVLATGACTTTVTESEIQSREERQDAQARKEEKRDQAIGQEGGDSGEEVDEEAGWADRESDL